MFVSAGFVCLLALRLRLRRRCPCLRVTAGACRAFVPPTGRLAGRTGRMRGMQALVRGVRAGRPLVLRLLPSRGSLDHRLYSSSSSFLSAPESPLEKGNFVGLHNLKDNPGAVKKVPTTTVSYRRNMLREGGMVWYAQIWTQT